MENVKKYTLYLGKYVKEEYAKRFKESIQETGINYDVIKLDSEFDEASKSVSNNGVALYCYFITEFDKEITGAPDSYEIYDNNMGLGIALMNRNLNTYLYQFKDDFKNMEEVIRNTCISLTNSIIWCENYLSVNY